MRQIRTRLNDVKFGIFDRSEPEHEKYRKVLKIFFSEIENLNIFDSDMLINRFLNSATTIMSDGFRDGVYDCHVSGYDEQAEYVREKLFPPIQYDNNILTELKKIPKIVKNMRQEAPLARYMDDWRYDFCALSPVEEAVTKELDKRIEFAEKQSAKLDEKIEEIEDEARKKEEESLIEFEKESNEKRQMSEYLSNLYKK